MLKRKQICVSSDADDAVELPKKLTPNYCSYGIEDNLQNADSMILQASINIDRMTDIAIGLEDYYMSVQQLLTKGGLDHQATIFLEQAMMITLKNTDVIQTDFQPALEMYGTPDSQLALTGYTLEAIEIDVKAIYDTIIKLVEQFINKVQLFYVQYLLSVDEFTKQVKALHERVNTLPEEKKTNVPITIDGTMYLNLSTNGSLIDPSGELERLGARINKLTLSNGISDLISKEITALNAIDFTKAEAVTGAAHVSYFHSSKSIEDIISFTFTKTSSDGIIKKRISENQYMVEDKIPYIGEIKAAFRVTPPREDEDMTMAVIMPIMIREPAEDNGFELKSWSNSEIKDTLQSIEKLLITLSKAKAGMQYRIKLTHDITNKSKVLSKSLKASNIAVKHMDAYNGADHFVRNLSSIIGLITEPILSFQKQGLRSSKAAYAFCLLSLKTNHKG